MIRISNTNNAFFRQLLFLLALIVMGIVIFAQLKFFTGTFLGAITLYVVLRGGQIKLVEERRMKPWLASLILVLGATFVLLGLVYLAVRAISSEVAVLGSGDIMTQLDGFLIKINDLTGYQIVPEKALSQSKATLIKMFSTVLNTTYSFAVNVFMMLVVLYFMLLSYKKLDKATLKYIPFKGKSLELLGHKIKGMIFSNAVGIPLIMFVQAIAAALIYWILGMPNIFFWSFITAIFGLMPVVGTGFIWMPLSVYFMLNGNTWSGVALFVYGLLIISNVDNLARIVLMKRIANTHPLVVIFGVLMGIPLFGFWGIIFGPLLISSFILLIDIYYMEYLFPEDLEKEKLE